MSDEPTGHNSNVEWEPRPLLYTADGKALRRAAGFQPMATQTRGTNPSLYTNKKGSKKG